MSWTGSARDEILLSIRRQLHGARGNGGADVRALRGDPSPGAPLDLESRAARVARFHELCEHVGGHVHLARDEEAAGAALEKIVEELGARDVAISDDPRVRRLAGRLGERARHFDGWRERRRLFECDLGLSGAQWGIAETGTLVLDSNLEKHRLVSLVPPVHVAVLDASAILPALGDAFAAAHASPRGLAPAITLVTGPSRTADIELTLVVGVHGPRELHILLIGSD